MHPRHLAETPPTPNRDTPNTKLQHTKSAIARNSSFVHVWNAQRLGLCAYDSWRLEATQMQFPNIAPNAPRLQMAFYSHAWGSLKTSVGPEYLQFRLKYIGPLAHLEQFPTSLVGIRVATAVHAHQMHPALLLSLIHI
eukprot:8850107-Alexandrium_andersonii.AAC.1